MPTIGPNYLESATISLKMILNLGARRNACQTTAQAELSSKPLHAEPAIGRN